MIVFFLINLFMIDRLYKNNKIRPHRLKEFENKKMLKDLGHNFTLKTNTMGKFVIPTRSIEGFLTINTKTPKLRQKTNLWLSFKDKYSSITIGFS